MQIQHQEQLRQILRQKTMEGLAEFLFKMVHEYEDFDYLMKVVQRIGEEEKP